MFYQPHLASLGTRQTGLSTGLIITDRSNVEYLLWFSVACFWCQSLTDVSRNVCSCYVCSVLVAEWPPFGKEMLTRLTICSLCILTICNFSYFPFWFRGRNLGSD